MQSGYCRICCLEFNEDMLTYSLFEDNDENNLTEIGRMFVECLFKEMEPNNGYFDHLCSECTSKLRALHEFRCLAFDASEKFKELRTNYSYIDDHMYSCEKIEIETPIVGDPTIEPYVFDFEQDNEVIGLSKLNEYNDEVIGNESSSSSYVKITSKTVQEDNDTEQDDISEEYLIDPDENRIEPPIANGSSPQSKGFKCKLCNIHLKSYRDFSSHNRDSHSQCEICHTQLSGQSNLVKHMETVHQKLECRCCGEIHFTSWSLSRHEALHHNWPRSKVPSQNKQHYELFECEICHKKLKGIRYLRIHKETVHRDLMCRHCGETNLKTLGELTRHEARHTNYRPFKCDLCDKCFPSDNSLQIHRQGHTNQRRFICEVCGSKFRNHSHMTAHLQSHNVEKFKCEFCDRTFQRSTSQRMHRDFHLRRNLTRCSLCGKEAHLKRKGEHVRYHKRKGEVAIMRRIPDNLDVCLK